MEISFVLWLAVNLYYTAEQTHCRKEICVWGHLQDVCIVESVYIEHLYV